MAAQSGRNMKTHDLKTRVYHTIDFTRVIQTHLMGNTRIPHPEKGFVLIGFNKEKKTTCPSFNCIIHIKSIKVLIHAERICAL